MKKIKLFFLAFLWVCLWLTSFSIADDVDHVIPFYINYPTFSRNFSSSTAYLQNNFGLLNYTFHFSDEYKANTSYVASPNNFITVCSYLESDYSDPLKIQVVLPYSYFSKSVGAFSSNNLTFSFTPWVLSWVCATKQFPSRNFNYIAFDNTGAVSSNFSIFNTFRFSWAPYVDSYPYTFKWSISFTWYFTINWERIWYFEELSSSSSVDCSQDSNYLQCLEDKNLLVWQVSTLSWNLDSCQSDLSSCRWWQDASLLACIDQKEQCESSLSTLSWNYASLENMNSSLSSQLQECLENSSWSWDLICNKFDLFRSSDDTNYSFPINNDLILPPWFKGFVNEWVLAIKKDSSLESSYSIDDEDFQWIVSDFWKVFLFIFSGGLFVLLLFIIRKYFTSLLK